MQQVTTYLPIFSAQARILVAACTQKIVNEYLFAQNHNLMWLIGDLNASLDRRLSAAHTGHQITERLSHQCAQLG
ncbi:MAG TPA: hypothetical protein DD666_02880 [Advenella kashmirensis]|uniref:Uncharacterized protein n=1 Tax=Advenella kashmirensis TaxID=310575 RepID=A0A356LBQ0_9BURK|nr:hypothetical protein [Advenella kashmirensis]